MRIFRRAVNACLRPLAAETTAEVRAFDRRVLRRLARIGLLLRIPNAERLGEAWMLDCFRILAGGIAGTPYGAELSLPYPLVISVSCANSCAFGCSFCYSGSTAAPATRTELTVELTAKIAESPVPIVFLTGGEPFHHPRLTEILGPILDRGKKVLIATNAPSVRVGAALLPHREQITILLSQWGQQEGHDAIRGRGNFERTRQAARLLSELGHRVSLNYVMSPGTILTDLGTVEEILAGSPHLHRVYLSRELLVGRAPVTARPEIDRPELWRRVRALGAKFPGRLAPALPELVPAAGLPAPHLLTRLLGITLPTSCGAAAWTLHVDSGGGCYPCFAHEGRLPVGSLLTEDLATVWQRARSLRQASPPMTRSRCWAEDSGQLLTLGPVRLKGDG